MSQKFRVPLPDNAVVYYGRRPPFKQKQTEKIPGLEAEISWYTRSRGTPVSTVVGVPDRELGIMFFGYCRVGKKDQFMKLEGSNAALSRANEARRRFLGYNDKNKECEVAINFAEKSGYFRYGSGGLQRNFLRRLSNILTTRRGIPTKKITEEMVRCINPGNGTMEVIHGYHGGDTWDVK